MGAVEGEGRAPAFVGRIKGSRRPIRLSFIFYYDRLIAGKWFDKGERYV